MYIVTSNYGFEFINGFIKENQFVIYLRLYLIFEICVRQNISYIFHKCILIISLMDAGMMKCYYLLKQKSFSVLALFNSCNKDLKTYI